VAVKKVLHYFFWFGTNFEIFWFRFFNWKF